MMEAEPEEKGVSYFLATREDLLLTLEDPSRVQSTIDIVAPLEVSRVLDVGCGIGQALFPLAVSKNALGIGVDVSRAGLRLGRQLYSERLPGARVTFVHSMAESLPFASATFDVVNCGLALPYTDNARAISEMARVLKPGGIFLLRIHHARYYLREFWRGLTGLDPGSVIHGGRVLVAGAIYHLFKRQPRTRFLNESFQTRRLLRRELERCGLGIEREQPNSTPQTPAFLVRKKQ